MCIAIPTVILCFIIALSVYNGYKNDIDVINIEFAETQKNEINNYMNGTSDKIAYLITYDELKGVLMNGNNTDFESIYNDTVSLNNSLTATFGYGESTLEIYTNNDNIYESKFIKKIDSETKKEFEKIKEDEKIYTLFSKKNDDLYFDMIRKVSFFDKNYGMIKISANAENVFCGFNYNRDNFTIIYDKNEGKTLPLKVENKENATKIFNNYMKGKNINYSVVKFEDIFPEYTIYSFISTTDLQRKSLYTISLYVFLLIIFGISLIFLVNKIVDSLTARITASVNNILSSDTSLAILTSSEPYDEFDIIQCKLDDLKKKLMEENKKIVELELKQLGNRVSLHFLYNIFAAIKCKTKDRDTIRSIEYLVEYCRNAFHRSEALVTVGKEIENIELYINLLQYSYGVDFIFDISLENVDKDSYILSNIVQPVVENAFIHGINSSDGVFGEIVLMFRREKDNIIIEVRDNALTADIEKINKNLNDFDNLNSALKVINKRIKLYYGEKCGIKYFEHNGYTVAHFMLSDVGKADGKKKQ